MKLKLIPQAQPHKLICDISKEEWIESISDNDEFENVESSHKQELFKNLQDVILNSLVKKEIQVVHLENFKVLKNINDDSYRVEANVYLEPKVLLPDLTTLKSKYEAPYILANEVDELVSGLIEKHQVDSKEELMELLQYTDQSKFNSVLAASILNHKTDVANHKFNMQILSEVVNGSKIEPIPEQSIIEEMQKRYDEYLKSKNLTDTEENSKQKQSYFSTIYQDVLNEMQSTLVASKMVQKLNITVNKEEIDQYIIEKYKSIGSDAIQAKIDNENYRIHVEHSLKISKLFQHFRSIQS